MYECTYNISSFDKDFKSSGISPESLLLNKCLIYVFSAYYKIKLKNQQTVLLISIIVQSQQEYNLQIDYHLKIYDNHY